MGDSKSKNINPVGVMQSTNPDVVRIATKDCIAASGDGKRFILYAGGGINENTPPKNIDIMIEVSRAKP